MDDLQDQIRAWADAASVGAEPVTVDEARARAERVGRRRGQQRRGPWLAAAAVLVVVVVVGAGLVVVLSGRSSNSGEERVTSDRADEGTDADVAFSVLGRSEMSNEPLGTLRSAVSTEGLDALWTGANLEGAPPPIDFAAQAVASITIADDLCPPTLEGFVRTGSELTPSFVEPPGLCEEPEIARTFVVALDWASTGPSFRLTLPAGPASDIGVRILDVGRPLPSGQQVSAVWPNQTTSADRSSPEAAARSFVAHVLGSVDVEATVDPTAPPDVLTAVDVDLGTARTTVLTAPHPGGWIVLQVGDGDGEGYDVAISTDPPQAQLPTVPGAEQIEVLVDTDLGATATVQEAIDVAGSIDLPPGTVRSIVTVYRADSGAVLALHAGSF